MPTTQSEDMLVTLKRVGAALRDAGVPFAVGGGIAAWARGGPATEHDLDLVIREEDADRALAVLGEEGLRTEQPPEEWLVKAWDGDILVDLVFRPAGFAVDDALLARCPELAVHAMHLPVLPLEDVLVSKLLALDEHHLQYAPVLELARSLREQIGWDEVRERTAGSPFARAFFVILDGLGITGGEPPTA